MKKPHVLERSHVKPNMKTEARKPTRLHHHHRSANPPLRGSAAQRLRNSNDTEPSTTTTMIHSLLHSNKQQHHNVDDNDNDDDYDDDDDNNDNDDDKVQSSLFDFLQAVAESPDSTEHCYQLLCSLCSSLLVETRSMLPTDALSPRSHAITLTSLLHCGAQEQTANKSASLDDGWRR